MNHRGAAQRKEDQQEDRDAGHHHPKNGEHGADVDLGHRLPLILNRRLKGTGPLLGDKHLHRHQGLDYPHKKREGNIAHQRDQQKRQKPLSVKPKGHIQNVADPHGSQFLGDHVRKPPRKRSCET